MLQHGLSLTCYFRRFSSVLTMSFVSYCSGKVIRRFVPVDKILKPVLLECLTPVTCYWSLSLIVKGEDELLLVFKVILLFI